MTPEALIHRLEAIVVRIDVVRTAVLRSEIQALTEVVKAQMYPTLPLGYYLHHESFGYWTTDGTDYWASPYRETMAEALNDAQEWWLSTQPKTV